MFETMLQTYRKKDNKAFFDDNEKTYDNYLVDLFGSYAEHQGDAQYYNALFSKMDQLFQSNAKSFSTLKHLGYDLAELLKKTGNLIHKISSVVNAQLEEEEKIYNVIKMNVKEDVDAINKKLKIGLTEWGSQLIAQSRHVIDNLAGFFHYRKHENLEFSKLLVAKQEANTSFIKSASDLERTKRKLFDAKNTDKWKVDFDRLDCDFNELFKDYDRVRPYMLPDVSLAGNASGRANAHN